MTGTELALIILGCLVILAILAHGKYLRIVTKEVIAEVHDKPVSSTVDQDIAAHLRRIAIATEKIVNERATQVESQHLIEQNEVLVQGVITVLDTTLTHPEGLKDDVIIGRDQATEEFKARLRAELDKALATTHQ